MAALRPIAPEAPAVPVSPASPLTETHAARPEIHLISGTSNRKLAEAVAAELGVPLFPAAVGKFANGETSVRLDRTVRHAHMYILVSPGVGTVNDDLMELLVLAQTAKLAKCHHIVAVVPQFPYARQDRKTTSRVPITAALVAEMLEAAGVDSVITVDLHAGQVQGMFRKPMDDLYSDALFERHLKTTGLDLTKLVIISPDAGGVARAKKLHDRIGAKGLHFIYKTRKAAGVVDTMELAGDVSGAECLIRDDMCDGGGTLCKAATMLRQQGATRVLACIAHGLFTGKALELITECEALEAVFVTDSLDQTQNAAKCPKLKVVSMAGLLAKAIQVDSQGHSMSQLFDCV